MNHIFLVSITLSFISTVFLGRYFNSAPCVCDCTSASDGKLVAALREQLNAVAAGTLHMAEATELRRYVLERWFSQFNHPREASEAGGAGRGHTAKGSLSGSPSM